MTYCAFNVVLLLGAMFTSASSAQGGAAETDLPQYDAGTQRVAGDWLVTPTAIKAGVFRGENPDEIVLSNGLIRRVWRIRPNVGHGGL